MVYQSAGQSDHIIFWGEKGQSEAQGAHATEKIKVNKGERLGQIKKHFCCSVRQNRIWW